jgi:hypothetical protein
MTFLQLLRKPLYAWEIEEINRLKTDPTGQDNKVFDDIDTVNDLIAYSMLARHHQVVADIEHYINTNQWIQLPKHIT